MAKQRSEFLSETIKMKRNVIWAWLRHRSLRWWRVHLTG